MDASENHSLGSLPVSNTPSTEHTASGLIRPARLNILDSLRQNNNVNEAEDESFSTGEENAEDDEELEENGEDDEEMEEEKDEDEDVAAIKKEFFELNSKFELQKKELENQMFDLLSQLAATDKRLVQLDREAKNFTNCYGKALIEMQSVIEKTNEKCKTVGAVLYDVASCSPLAKKYLTRELQEFNVPATEEVSKIQINVPQIGEKFSELLSKLNEAEEESEKYKTRVKEIQNERDDLKHKIRQLREEFRKMNEALDQNLQHPDLLQRSENEINRLNSTIVEMQAQLDISQQELIKLKQKQPCACQRRIFPNVTSAPELPQYGRNFLYESHICQLQTKIQNLQRELEQRSEQHKHVGENVANLEQNIPPKDNITSQAQPQPEAENAASAPLPPPLINAEEEEGQQLPAEVNERLTEDEKVLCQDCGMRYFPRGTLSHRACKRKQRKRTSEDAEFESCGNRTGRNVAPRMENGTEPNGKNTVVSRAVETLNQQMGNNEKM